MAAYRHRHFWRDRPLDANRLLAALPDGYRKVGTVNNGAISPGSGVESGFDRWKMSLDHEVPFKRTLRAIRRAGPKRPSFILLHSNIVHDYCEPVTTRYLPPGSPPVLGDRVISWRDTTAADRAAAAAAYATCIAAQKAKVEAVLDVVRERDDFVTAVTSDHGEGFDYELGRVHHGGRLHQDLLRVPLYFDLPSSLPEARRQGAGRRARIPGALHHGRGADVAGPGRGGTAPRGGRPARRTGRAAHPGGRGPAVPLPEGPVPPQRTAAITST